MERRDYTEQNPTIHPRQNETQCQEVSSSISEAERKEQEEQQEMSPLNKNHRTIEDILDPCHPYFYVHGQPFIKHIERNHKKSKTYMKSKEDDPMYNLYNNQTNDNKDHKNTKDERTTVSNNLNINVNSFRQALLSIKKT